MNTYSPYHMILFFSKFKFKNWKEPKRKERREEEGERGRTQMGVGEGEEDGEGAGLEVGGAVRRGNRVKTFPTDFPRDLQLGRPQGWYCLPAAAYLPSHPPQIQMFSSTRIRPGLHGSAEFHGHFMWVSVSSPRSQSSVPLLAHVVTSWSNASWPWDSLLWKMSGEWFTPPFQLFR